jgi:hypothetical protein
MSEFRLKDITIECSKCRHRKTFHNDDFVYESDAVDERSMGTEFQHTWKLEEYECENCHKFFSLSIDMWEYPIGCMNYQEKQIDGASFVNEPEIEELVEPDDGEN